jgi:GNAT superfamily N-acetyltransferase
MSVPEIVQLGPSDLPRIAEVDRSESVRLGHRVHGREIEARPVVWDVPDFDAEGDGDFSIAARIAEWSPELDRGGVLLGAIDGERLVGYAILGNVRRGGNLQLVALYVNRDDRRSGVAAGLFARATELARERSARGLYVSSVPSESAVSFYLSRGCVLADPPDPELFAKEPEDVHLVLELR